MTILLYFILGIAFYGLVMPVLEALISLVLTSIEYLKGKISLKMVKIQQEIDAGAQEPTSTYAIGFDTSCYVDQEDDDEEWEDDE